MHTQRHTHTDMVFDYDHHSEDSAGTKRQSERERERDGERERIKWLVASRYSVAVVSTIIPVFFSIIRLRVKDCRVAEPSLALREAEKATKQQTKRAIRQRRLEIRF